MKHVWFDVAGTLTIHTPEFQAAHNALRYKTYADAVRRPVTKELMEEYEALYRENGSNSAAFRSLGLPPDYWQRSFSTLDEEKYFQPDPRVYKTLEALKRATPLSLFTNMKAEKNLRILAAIDVDPQWFTHILTIDDIKEPKPSLTGFRVMIKRSKLPASDVLYVGDRVDVDVRPARAVGMQTCLVWSTSAEADYSFESFEGLLSLFHH